MPICVIQRSFELPLLTHISTYAYVYICYIQKSQKALLLTFFRGAIGIMDLQCSAALNLHRVQGMKDLVYRRTDFFKIEKNTSGMALEMERFWSGAGGCFIFFLRSGLVPEK